jgi:hypothetical protein
LTVYLASPNSQQQADYVADMPVLISYALWTPWMAKYQATFSRILIDSGAFGELTGNAKVDIGEFREWSQQWVKHADAIAGLDDISGDWQRSLKNYAEIPWTFPTIHDTDPPGLLPDLVAIARERNGWLGIGIKPPRQGKERFVRWVLDNVPDDIHVHGWALRAYTYIRGLGSVDSTNWWRDAMAVNKDLPWLTYGECMEIVVKRYIRETRALEHPSVSGQSSLWEEEVAI